MKLQERLLLLCSKGPEVSTTQEEWGVDNALSLLCRVFPAFENHIIGKTVLDFGCGEGYQAVALARYGAKSVLGIESNPKTLQKAVDLAVTYDVCDKVSFLSHLNGHNQNKFDVVISQNSMEHFQDPASALQSMAGILNERGRLFVTFGPPWFAPYGSHMQFFTNVPWVNLLFSEAVVMKVRARFRNDKAQRYEEVESGLNKMSVAKFERIVAESGMNIEYKRYDAVKGINFLSVMPLVRELFINHISCILKKGTNLSTA